MWWGQKAAACLSEDRAAGEREFPESKTSCPVHKAFPSRTNQDEIYLLALDFVQYAREEGEGGVGPKREEGSAPWLPERVILRCPKKMTHRVVG